MRNPYDSYSDEDKALVKEFVEKHWNAQWFKKEYPPLLIANHPNTMRKTLEVVVDYKPLNEMKHIYAFGDKHKIAIEFKILSN